MTRAAPLLLLALLAAAPATARAQRVMHRVRFGETPATISQHYYGNKAFAQVIQIANGIGSNQRPAKLTAGSYIRVPTAWVHTETKSTTFAALAARYLRDRRRWPALAMLNQIRGRRRRVKAGQKVLIPFILPYTITAGDDFTDLSQRFYGTKKYGGLIASFNFIKATRPSPGAQLEIPLGSPRIEPQVLEQLTNEQVLGLAGEESSERERLQEANALIRRGDYWEVPLRLMQLLARGSAADDSHIAEIFKLLAVAYVAVGQPELAEKSFREALLREPGLTLDVVTTSPKVMRAFIDAKTTSPKGTP